MKIKVAKDHYRINIPAELCNKLGIKRGHEIELELQDNKLIIYPIINEDIIDVENAESEESKKEEHEETLKKLKPLEHIERFYPSGQRYYEKYTPCNLYKFSRAKYLDKHCDSCNLDCLKYQSEETKLLCPKYNKDIINTENNINQIEQDINKTDNNKVNEIKDENNYTEENIKRFEEISKNTIRFLNSSMPQELLVKLTKQINCGVCNNELKDGENFIFNDKFICNNCKKDKLNELKELIKFKQRRL